MFLIFYYILCLSILFLPIFTVIVFILYHFPVSYFPTCLFYFILFYYFIKMSLSELASQFVSSFSSSPVDERNSRLFISDLLTSLVDGTEHSKYSLIKYLASGASKDELDLSVVPGGFKGIHLSVASKDPKSLFPPSSPPFHVTSNSPTLSKDTASSLSSCSSSSSCISPIKINQEDLPYSITTPGYYCLGGDLAFSAPTDNTLHPAISVASDNVTLDFAGHTLTLSEGLGPVIDVLGKNNTFDSIDTLNPQNGGFHNYSRSIGPKWKTVTVPSDPISAYPDCSTSPQGEEPSKAIDGLLTTQYVQI